VAAVTRERDTLTSWASLEGLPFPLGATWIPQGEAWNFAVYSEHAEQVTLLLYAGGDPSTPVVAYRLDHLRNKSGPVWHCRVPVAEMRGATFYAYQDAYAHRCDMCDQHAEFRELVRALHAAGLEVVLDVVYNHTGEGNHAGPVYSFKGLDNDTYYILSGRPDAPYADFSGTGNSLNSEHRYVRRMILDSLRYRRVMRRGRTSKGGEENDEE
jgi:pullulanase/glycogen debranching enzyme